MPIVEARHPGAGVQQLGAVLASHREGRMCAALQSCLLLRRDIIIIRGFFSSPLNGCKQQGFSFQLVL